MITTVSRPFRRTIRQFRNGSYGGRFALHKKYAQSPELYIRSFLILQNDLKNLFDYIEPSNVNLDCYSYRIHELLTRSCIEIESNFKAIFIENGNHPSKKYNWNISHYQLINETHRLSSYSVKFPYWDGDKKIRKPFKSWENKNSLDWYQAYNATKHNRHEEFKMATFDHMLDAICGLLVLLSAQFFNEDFCLQDSRIVAGGHPDGTKEAIGGYFRIGFPDDFPMNQRYEFNWAELEDLEDPFWNYNYQLETK